jgi:hypothetical protein
MMIMTLCYLIKAQNQNTLLPWEKELVQVVSQLYKWSLFIENFLSKAGKQEYLYKCVLSIWHALERDKPISAKRSLSSKRIKMAGAFGKKWRLVLL